MSLVLNGNGTIQNLVAGGLPDGSVTADDIASTLDLSGKTVTLPAGTGGKVLQVVNGTYSTGVASSSSTFADTGLTATITPTSATSKILVLVNQAGCGKEANNTYLFLRLLRDSTVISYFERFAGGNGSSSQNFIGSCSACYLDSPATASSVSYKTQLASSQNNAVVYTSIAAGGISSMSTITLMEIAA
jgi:hypothetical protein